MDQKIMLACLETGGLAMDDDAADSGELDDGEGYSVEEAVSVMRAAVWRRYAELEESLGGAFRRMTSSVENAIAYTDDPDPKFREAALYLMFTLWSREPSAQVALARAGLTDPSDHLRELALQWLTFAYLDKVDPNVSTLLARVVMDEKNSVQLRGRVYELFCMVRNIDISESVCDAIDAATDDLPPEIDLTLVRVFAADR